MARIRRPAPLAGVPGHGAGAAPAPAVARSVQATRAAAARAFAVAAMAAYNWWVLVPFKPSLMRSPDELFSNLEVTGQPFAAAMSHLDLLSGLLMLAALLAAGAASAGGGRGEWAAMCVFAVGGLVGGACPEICADSVSASCKRLELSLRLPAGQYVHMIAGVVEFAGITVALLLAWRRTRGQRTPAAAAYRRLAVGAVVGYPLLGAAYLSGRLGGVMEAAFFTGFTVMALTEIFERTRLRHGS